MEDLAPGYRFYPTEEELVSFYLRNKLQGQRLEIHQIIPVVDIYHIQPWHLPKLSGKLCQGDTEQWFFFVPRQEREARGGRPTRTTSSGYWKATGSPGYVYSSDNKVIGMKKTMVFYIGKAPAGRKTKWKMNEYRAIEQVPDQLTGNIPMLRGEFTLCRVYVVSGSLRAFDRRPLEPAPAAVVAENAQKAEPSSEPTEGQGSPPTITGLLQQQQQPPWVSDWDWVWDWDWEEMTSHDGSNQLDATTRIDKHKKQQKFTTN
ncbi:hypothetical protein SAY87_015650 [Trapa incisa]|uniref:NAC domain-containing protein n=1 Tax=Trapa incisa TaxID=236973 RepID=A0AAN7L7T7_9MYRT|nr:hypothetical protein SAY87_015650 [Trapa incisa]